jgi:Xaa-Pro aminopeptidase/Xaa-Pro dipeptidase
MGIAQGKGFDNLGTFTPENVFYLTNFWGEAIAVCDYDKTKLIVPRLEASRAEQESKNCEIVPSERGSQLIRTFMESIQGKKICIDFLGDPSLVGFFNGAGFQVTVDADILYQGRMIKEEGEIFALSEGAKILDDLYDFCTSELKIGETERALQAKIVFESMQMGANLVNTKSTLNPLIIASGPNGALPHSQASNRRFVEGDLIVVDLTIRFLYYIVDATRTFALGKVTKEQKEAYEIVKSAQQAGINSTKEGVACEQIDQQCRQLIDSRGYGDKFIHSTGHGIGLEVHEPPWLRDPNKEILKKNMALTIEPGIYASKKFGIRIEDSILVNGGQARALNSFTKDILIL